MKVEPYLFFDGRCEEAIQFYRSALGAEVLALMRFKECPDPRPPGMVQPGWEDKIMHAALRIGESQMMASDGMGAGQPEFKGVWLSISVANEAEADRLFTVLGEGGQVQMPIAKTFFSPRFGMVKDRFGVAWMIVANQPA